MSTCNFCGDENAKECLILPSGDIFNEIAFNHNSTIDNLFTVTKKALIFNLTRIYYKNPEKLISFIETLNKYLDEMQEFSKLITQDAIEQFKQNQENELKKSLPDFEKHI